MNQIKLRFFLIGISKFFDLFTTFIFLRLGVKEANPIMIYLMNMNEFLAYGISFIGVLLMSFFIYFLVLKNKIPKEAFDIGSECAIIINTGIVFNNVYWIIRSVI